MRKILIALLSVFSFVVVSFAAAPTNAAVDAIYENGGIEYDISTAAGFDTLSGVDSTILVTGRAFPPGWQYVLIRDAITGGGSDSVAMQVIVDALDKNGNLFYRSTVDSFTTAAGEAVLLPLTGTIFGSKIRIKLVSYTGNGGVVILNRFSIYKRRPLVIQQNWK